MNKTYDVMVKIMLIGDSSVGKTSFIQTFCEPGSIPVRNIRSTVGLDYGERIIPINGKNVLVQLWDTAGQ